MRNRKQQTGFTFTEIALGLALFVLVSISGFASFQALSDRNKVNDTIKEVGAIFSAAEDWKAGKASFTGIDMATLDAQGLVPSAIGVGTGTNPWGANYQKRRFEPAQPAFSFPAQSRFSQAGQTVGGMLP